MTAGIADLLLKIIDVMKNPSSKNIKVWIQLQSFITWLKKIAKNFKNNNPSRYTCKQIKVESRKIKIKKRNAVYNALVLSLNWTCCFALYGAYRALQLLMLVFNQSAIEIKVIPMYCIWTSAWTFVTKGTNTVSGERVLSPLYEELTLNSFSSLLANSMVGEWG